MQACNFIKKETLAQVFSCEFPENSKNIFLTEHLRTTGSVKRLVVLLKVSDQLLRKPSILAFLFNRVFLWNLTLPLPSIIDNLSFWNQNLSLIFNPKSEFELEPPVFPSCYYVIHVWKKTYFHRYLRNLKIKNPWQNTCGWGRVIWVERCRDFETFLEDT